MKSSLRIRHINQFYILRRHMNQFYILQLEHLLSSGTCPYETVSARGTKNRKSKKIPTNHAKWDERWRTRKPSQLLDRVRVPNRTRVGKKPPGGTLRGLRSAMDASRASRRWVLFHTQGRD